MAGGILHSTLSALRRMKTIQRALRRHHLARLKKKRRHDYAMCSLAEEIYGTAPTNKRVDPVRLGKHVTTPACCSCWMCGNPRRHFGQPGLQEKSASEAEVWDMENLIWNTGLPVHWKNQSTRRWAVKRSHIMEILMDYDD